MPWTPLPWTPLPWTTLPPTPCHGHPAAGPPKISRFFSPLPPQFSFFFFLSLGVFSCLFSFLSGSSRGILVVFWSVGTSNVLVFALRLSCETQAAGGFHMHEAKHITMIFKESRTGLTRQTSSQTDDSEARNDFWSIARNFFHRHHVQPRTKRSFPTLSSGRMLHGMCSRERLTKIQVMSRPDPLWPENQSGMSQTVHRGEKKQWVIEKTKFDNAKKLTGIFFICLEDVEFQETMNNARTKLVADGIGHAL